MSTAAITSTLAHLLSHENHEVATMTIEQLLQPLELELSTATAPGIDDVRYMLTVHHRGANAVWNPRRSFDEYLSFHRRIRHALHHGHFCTAGCPWLESFLGNALAKTTSVLYSDTSATLIERHRKAVLQMLQTLQQFLVNRLKDAWTYTVHHVAYVFLDFVYDSVVDRQHVLDRFLRRDAAITTSTTINNSSSIDTKDPRLGSASPEHQHSPSSPTRQLRSESTSALLGDTCYHSSSRGPTVVIREHHHQPNPTGSRKEASTTCTICSQLMPVSGEYTVLLQCGHRFHDECVLPKLNQALACPTLAPQLVTSIQPIILSKCINLRSPLVCNSIPLLNDTMYHITQDYLTNQRQSRIWTIMSAPTSSVRLFVGGLAADVTAQELRERFERVAKASHCVVADVEVPPNHLTPSAASRGFAYLTLRGSAADVAERVADEICKAYHRTKWRGSVLRVERAKPDYMERWRSEEAERAAERTAKEAAVAAERERMKAAEDAPEVWTGVAFEGKMRMRFESFDGVRVEQVEERTEERTEGTKTDTESDLDTEQDEEEEVDEEGSSSSSEEEEEQEVVAPAPPSRVAHAPLPPPPAESLEDANARRLAALQDKLKKQQQSSAEAKGFVGKIDVVGGAAGKKITFDEDGEVEEIEDRRATAKSVEEKEEDADIEKTQDNRVVGWLDSDEEEEEHDDAEDYGELDDAKRLASSSAATSSAAKKIKTLEFDDGQLDAVEAADDASRFALRPEFLGERGKKLFELQKRFGGDQRFRLDARFMEDEENEYADGGAAEEPDEDGEDASGGGDVEDLQAFRTEEDTLELATHEAEMAAEQDQALKILGELIADLDVDKIRQRIEAQKHRDPIKEASWMGQMKRYDPRVASSGEYELPMEDASKNNIERQQEKAVEEEERRLAEEKRAREEKEVLVGGDRFYAASSALGSLFTRVRKNSEDGEVGEAALDGVFGRGGGGVGGGGGGEDAEEGAAPSAFKLSSLFSVSFGGGNDAKMKEAELVGGEALLEDEDNHREEDEGTKPWYFTQTFGGGPQEEDNGTDKEEEEEEGEEEEPEEQAPLGKSKRVRVQRSLDDFLAFGRTFFSSSSTEDKPKSKEEQVVWVERRKKLTLDFKRKRRDALKSKKKQQQQHKRQRMSER